MAERSRRFNSVSTSRPRFKARMGRVDSLAPSSWESKCSSECGVTCSCMSLFSFGLASIHLPNNDIRWSETMISSVATAEGSLGAAAASCGDPVSYICTVWIGSGCLRWEVVDPGARCSIGAGPATPGAVHSATIRDPILMRNDALHVGAICRNGDHRRRSRWPLSNLRTGPPWHQHAHHRLAEPAGRAVHGTVSGQTDLR